MVYALCYTNSSNGINCTNIPISKMNKEIYALEDYDSNDSPTIFLAGPTPRDNNAISWRPDMIKSLRENGFDGDIFIPEQKGDYIAYDYPLQIAWEAKYLRMANVILFWIPRELKYMPAFTTNIEFGEFLHSGKITLGFPTWAEKMDYIEERAENNNIPIFYTMDELAKHTIEKSIRIFKIMK